MESKIPRIRRILRFPKRVSAQAREDVDAEIRFHIESRTAGLMRTGLSEDEARAHALRDFGDVEHAARRLRRESRIRERRSRIVELLDSLALDLRHALRRLRARRGFTGMASVTLALGIGATTAIFSVVHGVLLEPLPYPDSKDLVFLRTELPAIGATLYQTEAAYVVFSEESRALSQVGAYLRYRATVTSGERPERIRGARVSHQLFATLGVSPQLGASFTIDHDRPGAPGTVVLSHGLWRRMFGGDPQVVGHTLSVDGRPREIVGIMPSDFRFPDDEAELWIPLGRDASNARPLSWHLRVVGRLAPDVSRTAAEAELMTLFPRTADRFGGGDTFDRLSQGLQIRAIPLRETVVGSVERTLWVVLCAVGVILLIACANVANLFLVQSEAREREVAVRAAIGASRGRLIRHFLTESATLGVFGGAMGIVMAFAATRLIVALEPGRLPRLDEIGVNGEVLLFAAAVSLLSGLAFGALPALRVRSDGLGHRLKEGGRTSIGGRSGNRMRNGLVVSQLALGLVLIAGSGLTMRTFWNLRAVNPGFQPEDLLTFNVSLPSAEYPTDDAVIDTHQRIVDRLSGLPAVTSVGAGTAIPLDPEGNWFPGSVWVDEEPLGPDEIPPAVWRKMVTPSFLETLEVPLLAGRWLDRRDQKQGTGALLVSERFARDHWSNARDALGKRARLHSELESPRYTIVGVVGDTRESALGQEPTRGAVYWTLRDRTGAESIVTPRGLKYVIRTDGPPEAAFPAVREVIRAVDPHLPLSNVANAEEIIRRAMARTSFTMVLLALAASIALVLGSVGIYAVISYAVMRRTHEIGLRVALGATRSSILRMVLRGAGVVVAAGVALGLLLSLAAARLLSAFLVGVRPIDPATYAVGAALIAAAALLASYVPAGRAAAMDPIAALRHE